MTKIKKVLDIILISIFISVQFSTICLAAAIPVTDENLNEALNKVTDDADSISAANNIINIVEADKTYTVNYDLTDKPTFIFETLIEKGISYEEFEKQEDNLLGFPLLCYSAVANIQGVEKEDSLIYFGLSYAQSALNQNTSNRDKYIIVDDLNLEEGVTIEKNDDPNYIYTSEFGDRVIEYVDDSYITNLTASDSDDINSYVFTIEKQDITETSRKLVSKLIVNLDADFAQIKGTKDKIEDSFSDITINSGITKENADTVLTLKVGQKCIIKSDDKIKGYELYGPAKINNDYTEIVATKDGVVTGYLYVGDVKKSFYITVEENPQNLTYEPATITIKKKVNTTVKEEVINVNNNNNQTTATDNSQANKEIPKTGSNFIMKRVCLSIAGIATVILIFILIYNKKLGMNNGTKR